MKHLSFVAVSILVIAAVAGFSKPGYAEEFTGCLDLWKGYVLKKCIKIKGADALECLEKADYRFKKCIKKAEDVDKKTRKKLVKCMNKRALDRDEFKDLSKSKRKKAVLKFLKWTDKCTAKIIPEKKKE